jgi:hypothetical protein
MSKPEVNKEGRQTSTQDSKKAKKTPASHCTKLEKRLPPFNKKY